jgi:hypothetical protein
MYEHRLTTFAVTANGGTGDYERFLDSMSEDGWEIVHIHIDGLPRIASITHRRQLAHWMPPTNTKGAEFHVPEDLNKKK